MHGDRAAEAREDSEEIRDHPGGVMAALRAIRLAAASARQRAALARLAAADDRHAAAADRVAQEAAHRDQDRGDTG